MSSKDDLSLYKPSHYSSILPNVELSKSKPLIQVVDAPPTAARNNISHSEGGGQSGEVDKDGEIALPTALYENPTNSSNGEASKSTNVVKVVSATTFARDLESTSTNQQTNICSTCTKNIARYTCPKCSEPYCSVNCYKIHDGTEVSEGNKLCTESFYKNRVLGEYHARGSDEDKMKLRGILNRLHQDIGMQMDDAEWRENSLSQLLREKQTSEFSVDVLSELKNYHHGITAVHLDDASDKISDEELAELASYILNFDQEEDLDAEPQARVQQIKETLPPHLLRAFECAMVSVLEQECKEDIDGVNLIEGRSKNQSSVRWQPWWLPEIDQISREEDVATISPNLDERILSIQPLPSLSSQPKNRNLAYNILDVLFAACFALKTTMVSSALRADDTVDSLLSQSRVLSNNAIYENVHEAMSSCSQNLVEISKISRISTELSWDNLASDVALISRNRRYVLRMLFEAADVIDSGIELLKGNSKLLKKTNKAIYEEKKKEIDETKRQYKLTLKKLEYFQSWCSLFWSSDLGEGISEEISLFVTNWKMPKTEEKESYIESILGSMLTNDSPSAIAEDSIDIEESAKKGSLFRMGNEMIAVSSTVKKDKV